jgi:hypothetical protein
MFFIDTENYNEAMEIADACIVNLDEIKEETKDKVRKDGFIVGISDNILMIIPGIARALTYDEYKCYANPIRLTYEEYVNFAIPIKLVQERTLIVPPVIEQLNIQSLKDLIAQSDDLED